MQIDKDHGLRICENEKGGIDVVRFEVDGHYVHHKAGSTDELLLTIPLERREIVSDFIKP